MNSGNESQNDIRIVVDQRTLYDSNVSHNIYAEELRKAFDGFSVEVVPNAENHEGSYKFAFVKAEITGEPENLDLKSRLQVAWRNAVARSGEHE